MDSAHSTLEDRVDKLLLSLSSLGDLGETLTSTGDFSATMRSLLHLVLGALTISKGAMLLCDREQNTLSVRTSRGLGRVRPTIQLEDEWVQVLVRENRPLSRSDLDRLLKPLSAQYAEQLDALQMHLWVPLVVRDNLLGVLSLSERFMKYPYTDDDLKLLSTMARHISVGIYNHRLIEEVKASNFSLNHKVLELETLHDLGMDITSMLNISELVDEILIRLVGILDVRGGFLMLKDEITGKLEAVARFGIEEEDIRRMRLSDSGDLLAEAIGTGKSSILNGIGEQLAGASLQNVMLIPLKGGEEILGVLGVLDKESREAGVIVFTEEDERLAHSFANQAGIAVANARLYKNILDAKNRTQSILTSISSGVISTDMEGRIESLNRSARRILGTEGDELLGGSYRELADRLNNEEIGDLIGSVLSSGVGGQATQLECQTDSRSLVMNVSVAPLRDQEERLLGLVIALEDLSEENRIRSIFKRYVSDQVVDMLLRPEARPTFGGEERDVVVLFSDLRGFTGMLEKEGAEEVVATLNAYYEKMFEVIFRYNGTLKDMVGDGVMVLYGVPISFGDEMERAIRTALEMREALHRLNTQRSEMGKEPLGMGIGISTGRGVAGSIGSRQRMDYMVVGDPVNLGSRLVDIAASDQILLSKEVYRQIKDTYQAEYFRTIRVKGKRTPVDIYELKGEGGPDVIPEPKKERGMKKTPDEVDLTIPMLPEMELAAAKTATAVGEFMRLGEEKIEDIRMGLIEACLNAIEHSKSKDRKVYINFGIHDNELEITIQDFGEGFDVEEARRRTAERDPKTLQKRQWGLRIMEELMDSVEVTSSSKGTLIRMVKRR